MHDKKRSYKIKVTELRIVSMKNKKNSFALPVNNSKSISPNICQYGCDKMVHNLKLDQLPPHIA